MNLTTGQKLFLVKLLHSIIWLIMASLVFYIVWSGLQDKPTAAGWWAVAVLTGETIVLLVYGWRCPLTVVARKYSDSQRNNFDIFLPEWLAKYNKLIFGGLFIFGLAMMIYKEFFS